jgi:alcohol dehydrogenase class IV
MATVDACGDMLLASAMAGIAFNATRLGLGHAFALPLGRKFGIAHGLVNAIMLPAVIAYNPSSNVEGYSRSPRCLANPRPIGQRTRCLSHGGILALLKRWRTSA